MWVHQKPSWVQLGLLMVVVYTTSTDTVIFHPTQPFPFIISRAYLYKELKRRRTKTITGNLSSCPTLLRHPFPLVCVTSSSPHSPPSSTLHPALHCSASHLRATEGYGTPDQLSFVNIFSRRYFRATHASSLAYHTSRLLSPHVSSILSLPHS